MKCLDGRHAPLVAFDRSIADVGREVGFPNLANVDRRFLDISGMTPGEFRRQGRDR